MRACSCSENCGECSRLQSVNTTAGASVGIRMASLCVLHAQAMIASDRIAMAARVEFDGSKPFSRAQGSGARISSARGNEENAQADG